ncbi:MAG: DNA-directed RNA polymerase subunit beta' [Armatimonadota bacterium]|nr:DNA-directed RNA polymerase subunit beta' [Armatimonadota bacterium]
MPDVTLFDRIRIGIASPEDIVGWSHGEVKKPETINYRTFKPERDGLFCERIFGPAKDWECHCGRYKKVKYKGIVCERCGVEVTRSRVRRERMGHIELAAPVCHIWYLKGVPSPISLVLEISPRLLEKVIYFASFIVIDIDREKLDGGDTEIRDSVEEEKKSVAQQMEALEQEIRDGFEQELEENKDEYDDAIIKDRTKAINDRIKAEQRETADKVKELDVAVEVLTKLERNQLLEEDKFRAVDRMLAAVSRRTGKEYSEMLHAGIGALAVKELLSRVDLESLARELRHTILKSAGPKRARAIKRLEVVEALVISRTRPEWMILEVVPVISPELRPMVQLDGGRFATSDLNDLYRRIINRNNRLKKIIEIRAPESIINHEKRLLQEAVDALVDNGRRNRPVVGSNNRPLKSLSDMLKGKEGRFRKNLLGKRVDYSGRSVIVVGPHLKLHQCGLPKEMALELFKPFVMKTLVDQKLTANIKTAKRMIDRVQPQVWDALEEVIKEHPVLLNRAPTLHRLGIQAFEPVLVEGKAIQVHPLVCHAYNADFDGDQMAVHVPLSAAAQAEARVLMLSTHNLFSPADGRPTISPIQDIVLGGYALTMTGLDAKKRLEDEIAASEKDPIKNPPPRIYAMPEEVISRIDHPDKTVRLHLNEPVLVRLRRPLGQPEGNAEQEHEVVTRMMTPGQLLFHEILPYPFKHSEKWLNLELTKKNMTHLVAEVRLARGNETPISLLDALKNQGFTWATRYGLTVAITDMDPPEERHQIIESTQAKVDVLNEQYEEGSLNAAGRRENVLRAWGDAYRDVGNAIEKSMEQYNPLSIVTTSGARGSIKQLTQLAGMRGLMSDPFGNIIEDLPIRSNFHEGLGVFEYFVSTHGARKGLADTALRTADAGYLTRRLVDVAQDVVIRDIDCGTTEGIAVARIGEVKELVEELGDRCRGRSALSKMTDPETGALLVDEVGIVSEPSAQRITKLEQVYRDARIDLGSDEKALTALEAKYRKAGFVIGDNGELMVGLRSALTCELEQGICSKCYGNDMSSSTPVEIGVAVGIIAAQSIGEPGTQLTMRTFHTGGIASQNVLAGVKDVRRQKSGALREIMSDQERGILHFSGDDILDLKTEQQRVLADITSASDEEIQKKAAKKVSKPSRTSTKSAEQIAVERAMRATKAWMSKLVKLLESEISGIHRVEELFEARHPKGEAIISEFDGRAIRIHKGDRGRWVAIETELPLDKEGLVGKSVSRDVLHPETGEVAFPASQDITDKALTLFKKAKWPKGVTPTIPVLELVLVPYRGNLEIKEGDRVRASDRLTQGPLDPHKLLQLRGTRGVQEYLVQEIQKVYKAQGVDINDKHVEVICRQMLRKRKIREGGDSYFLPGQIVDRFAFNRENERIQGMIDAGEKISFVDDEGTEVSRKPLLATADWVMLGITEASLATESFLSAASFQKTTRVLTDAAVRGKSDDLVGLKENVIIGRLIPAGTGFPEYRKVEVELLRQPTWSDKTISQVADESSGGVLPPEEVIDGDEPNPTDMLRLAESLGFEREEKPATE